MRISTKRILSIGLSFALLIGTVLVYFNLIVPEVQIVMKMRGEINAKERLYTNQKAAVDKVKGLIAQFKNIETLRQTVSLALPNGEDVIGALRQIEGSARATNVVLASLNVKSSAGIRAPSQQLFIRRLGTIEISVSAKGPYESLKQFLSLLETSVRVMNLKDVNFQPGSAARGSAEDTLKATVEVYYQDKS